MKFSDPFSTVMGPRGRIPMRVQQRYAGRYGASFQPFPSSNQSQPPSSTSSGGGISSYFPPAKSTSLLSAGDPTSDAYTGATSSGFQQLPGGHGGDTSGVQAQGTGVTNPPPPTSSGGSGGMIAAAALIAAKLFHVF